MTDLSSAQGRYYLLDSPVASPGLCGVCGYSSNDRRYLDPRLDFEFYGSLIFCEECVASMSVLLGHLTPELVQKLEARVEAAETELVRLRAITTAFEDFRVAFGAVDGSSSNGSGGSSNLPNITVPATVALVASDVIGEGSGDSTSDEPSVFEGSDDVRDDSGNDDFDFTL